MQHLPENGLILPLNEKRTKSPATPARTTEDSVQSGGRYTLYSLLPILFLTGIASANSFVPPVRTRAREERLALFLAPLGLADALRSCLAITPAGTNIVRHD